MRAVVWTGAELETVDLPDPSPGPGEVVVQVEAAGLCHSDLTVMAREPAALAFGLPAVLGHEMAGTVVGTGPGIHGVAVGDTVAGYGPRGCRACARCAAGAENYCRDRTAAPSAMPGLGAPGALAELTVVDQRYLVRTGGLEPAQAATLTDAGLTPYAAIRRARPRPGSTVVVLGIGGLGHVAVQLLVARGDVTVVGVDVAPERLTQALELGAHHALAADEDLVGHLDDLTGGTGAEVVLDLVASNHTLATAAHLLSVDGVLSVLGVGSGRASVGQHAYPLGTRVDLPFWGTLPELHDVVALARRGAVQVRTTEFGLDQTATAYAELAGGRVLGRAVVRPQVAATGEEA